MPQVSFEYFNQLDPVGRVHLHKTVCPNGKCRLGPTVHLSKTAAESHAAILHGLDRKVGKLFFGTDPFLPTIQQWNGTPLVFAQVHPEPRDFSSDPNSELDRINGAIIGEASDAFIEKSGHPKLMLTKNYTDETAIRMFGQGLITEDQLKKSQEAVPVALKLLAEGKLSHSSAFICPDDGEKLTGTVIPNHILEFEETERDQPVDRMAVVLNKTEDNDVTGSVHTNIGKAISAKNAARLKVILDGITSFFDEIITGDSKISAVSGSYVPKNPAGSGIAPDSTGWKKPALSDFTDKQWSDLSDVEKSRIASHFAFNDGNDSFGALHLPHHDPKTGDAVPAAVRNALARLSQTQGLGDSKDAVQAHLDAHMEKIQAMTASKTNAATVVKQGTMNEPDGESLEDQIEVVRQNLTNAVGLKYPDGTPRPVWTVMTLPDKVIWQHPDTSKYYMTGYTIGGDDKVAFDSPVEVEQAYVVKEANTVFLNMTAGDLETIVKRNKSQEITMPTPEEIAAETAKKQKDADLAAKDAQIAQLQKERDDLAAEKAQVQKQKFDAAWDDLKKKVIPPAEVKDPADEVKLQKMSVDDPLGFAAKIATWKAAPAMGEEGSAHVSGPDARKQEAAELDRVLKASSARAVPGTFH